MQAPFWYELHYDMLKKLLNLLQFTKKSLFYG